LPKAPKNLKSQGGKKSAKKNFVGKNNQKNVLSKKLNFLKNQGERQKINYKNFLEERRKRREKRGQSMNMKRSKEEFKNLENSRMNFSNDDVERNKEEDEVNEIHNRENKSLSVRFQKFMKYKKSKMKKLQYRKKPEKSQNIDKRSKKNVSASFREFMKLNKSKNSLLKNFKEKLIKKSNPPQNLQNHSQNNQKNLQKKSKSRRHSNIIPPIPLQDVSKQRLREQIMYGRFGQEITKSSRDELKTLKRRTREMHYKCEDFAGGEITTNRKSTSRLQILTTKDQRKKDAENCINSSEFLRSQMIKAKGLDGQNSYRDFQFQGEIGNPGKDQNFLKENCENVQIRKLSQYKKVKKFHLDFGSIGVDIHSIYAKDNYIPTKISKRKQNEFGRDPVRNPRLSRHEKDKGKKILFPKTSFRQEKNERRNSKKKCEKKKFYSLSRQLLAGRISKKLDEFSKGDKKKQSESFSRSFRRGKKSRRETNSFVLERRASRGDKRNVSLDCGKMMR